MDVVHSESDLVRAVRQTEILGKLIMSPIGVPRSNRRSEEGELARDVHFRDSFPWFGINILYSQVGKVEEIGDSLHVRQAEQRSTKGTHHGVGDQIGVSQHKGMGSPRIVRLA